MGGVIPVYLSYHWRTEEGVTVEHEATRTALTRDVPPNKQARQEVTIDVPTEPGAYTLTLDAVREHVAWFSSRGGATCEAQVEVIAPAAADAAPPEGTR